MKATGVWEFFLGEIVSPWSFGEGLLFGGVLPHPHVTHAHSALGMHLDISARPHANKAVTGGVDKEGGFEFANLVRAGFERKHSTNFVFAVHFHVKGVVAEEKREVLFVAKDLFFLVVFPFIKGGGGGRGRVFEFTNDVTHRVESSWCVAFGPDPDFRTSVTTEHVAVLD